MPEKPPGTLLRSFNPYIRYTIWIVLARSFIAWTFYTSSDQISLQRLLSTSSYKQAKRALFSELLIIEVPIMVAITFIGIALWVFYQRW